MKNSFGLKRTISFIILLAGFCLPIISHAGGKVAVWGDKNYGQTSLPNGLDNVKAIAGGWRHSLALKTDGTVVAWGYNSGGATNFPSGLTNVVAISAKSGLSLALRADGTVVRWGGADATDSIISSLSNIVAVAAGWYHWLALKSDGTIVTAGVGATTNNSPTNLPPGLSNVVAISAGIEFSVALKSDGKVVAWGGTNAEGQTNVPTGLSNVVAIATGFSHSLALKADGTVVTWGAVGDGVPSGLSNVVAIAAGARHSLALKSDGTIVAWWAEHTGFPDYGQIVVPPGLSNVKAIAAGEGHSLALVFDGPPEIVQQPESTNVHFQSNIVLSVVARGMETLSYRWFFNGNPLNDSTRISGANTAALSISNAQYTDTGTYTIVVSNGLGSVTSTGAMLNVIGPPTIVQQPVGRTVRAGSDVSLSVVASGTATLKYQWIFNGTNIFGATNSILMFNNVQPASSGIYFVQITNLYGSVQSAGATLTVTNSAPYILVQPTNQTAPLGGSASFTVSARGSTPLHYQWRFNGSDISNATNATLSLSGLSHDQTGFYTVAIRNAFGETNSAKAFLNVSQILVWGDPFNGNTNLSAGLTNAVAVAAGGSHIAALKSDGTVKVWMANSGYLFDFWPAITNIPSSATNIIAIAAGRDHTVALRSNGTVVAWGGNASGQTNVPPGLSNVVQVAAGWYRSFAVKSDGSVTGWGQATVPPGLSNVVAISAAASHNMALRRDGTVFAWGNPSIATYLTNLTGLSNAIAIAAGNYGNLALRENGTVWISPNSRILLPPNLSNRVAIAANNFASMALKNDGTVTASGTFGKAPSPLLSNVTAIAIGGVQSEFGVAIIGDGAPFITLQPRDQVLKKGDNVRLHARVVGAQPMNYQWQLEDQNIPGATNATLVITNLQGKDTGNYRMHGFNALGSVMSATARLTIPFNTNLAAALNTTNLVWDSFSSTSKTSGVWFAQIRETHDDDVAAQSGSISHNQQSQLNTTVVGPGTLTFWWKVSSEGGYDFLKFNLDSESVPRVSISGEAGWEKKTISIPSGSHVLRWSYAKDGTVSSGRDAGWVDEVKFTPFIIIARQLSPVEILPDGTVLISTRDASGEEIHDLPSFTIQTSTNIQDWITLPITPTLTNGSLMFHDTNRGDFPQRFYRIIEH